MTTDQAALVAPVVPVSGANILDFVARVVPEFLAASWRPWLSVLAAVFGLEPPDPALVRMVTGRSTLPTSAARETFWIVGRGAGKSRIVALLAAFFATVRVYPRVAGETIFIVVIAPDRRQARVTREYIVGILESRPELAAFIARQPGIGSKLRKTLEIVELTNGVTIEIITPDHRRSRGRSIALAIVEEAAFLPQDDSATPDTELLRALRPALARVPGSLLAVASSPYARRGELYRAYREHFGKDGDTLVVQADTLTLNPTFDRRAVDQAYRDDPASAAAEYGAEFRTDVETFLSREALDAAVVPGRLELPRIPGVTYRVFFDFAGGSGTDSATAAVAHSEGEREILDAIREVRPPFSPEETCQDFATLCQTYGVSHARADRWGGQFPVEQMGKLGITVEVSERTKSEIYKELLPLMMSRRCELLDLPRLLAQLGGLERRTARGGRDSIDHPAGSTMHDDVANAAAGALVMDGATDGTAFLQWLKDQASSPEPTKGFQT